MILRLYHLRTERELGLLAALYSLLVASSNTLAEASGKSGKLIAKV